MADGTGWMGVGLDGTLAEWHGWQGIDHIGAPVPSIVTKVKQWLKDEREVRVVTARVNPKWHDSDAAREVIVKWCLDVFDTELPVTCELDPQMVEFWDTRVVRVIANKGERADNMMW